MAPEHQQHTPSEPNAANDAHCEYCGVYYKDSPGGGSETDTERPDPPPERAVDKVKPAPPEGDADAELTHCEFCGAEYPVPG